MAARKTVAPKQAAPRARLTLAWYERRDYPRLMELCRGGCLLPADWAEWHRQAMRLERVARQQGVAVDRIAVAPGDLMHWAHRRRWCYVDADRLHLYVESLAARQRAPTRRR